MTSYLDIAKQALQHYEADRLRQAYTEGKNNEFNEDNEISQECQVSRQAVPKQEPEVLGLLHQEAEFKKTLGAALASLRRHLPPSLAALEDEKIIALANWAILVALRKLVDELKLDD